MALRRFLQEPGGWRITLGGSMVLLLLISAIAGPHLTSYAHDEMDLEQILAPPEWRWLRSVLVTERGSELLKARDRAGIPKSGTDELPDSEGGLDFLRMDEDSFSQPVEEPEAKPQGHILGTDNNGRDMMALLVAGSRNALLPGLVACLVALGVGLPLGLIAGFYGGLPSALLGGFSGVVLSLPRFVLILVVISALAPNVYYIMAVLGLTLVPRISEHIASRVRSQAGSGFVTAAREGGLDDISILTKHIFWYQNRALLFIHFALVMAESILVETTLSYLQFGTKAPDVSWGNIIEGSRMTFFSGIYWITFFPAAAIVMAILGFFYLGDGLSARMAYREGK